MANTCTVISEWAGEEEGWVVRGRGVGRLGNMIVTSEEEGLFLFAPHPLLATPPDLVSPPLLLGLLWAWSSHACGRDPGRSSGRADRRRRQAGPSEHDTLTKCWINAGTESQTVAQL